MKFEPLPSQRLAIPHLVEHEVAALFAGMGTGKTGAVLAALDQLFCDGAIRGALVVAPLRVALLTWPQEVERWDEFRWMKVADLRTDEGRAAWKGGTAHIYVINYEGLPKFIDECVKPLNGSWTPADVVVWDELSKAKNPSGKRINRFRRDARKKFSRHWGLTGTPVPNSHLDLFAQIRLLDGGERLGTAFGKFRTLYFYPENSYTPYPKFLMFDRSKGEIEEKISDITLTLRSEDYLDIPPVGVEDIEVALPQEAREMYAELEKELLVMLEEGELVALSAAALCTKLLQITGGTVYVAETKIPRYVHYAKIGELLELHKREGKEPMLVACAYRHEMERICRLDGAELFSTDKVAAWNRGEIPLMVMHPASGGHGLNLQEGGSRVVWMTPTYSRESYDQLNARVARTGQTEPVKIFRILCPDTIDDAVVEALRTKGDNQDSLMATLKNLQRLKQ